MDGQTYVTVQANVSRSKTRIGMNSGSAIGGTYVVNWDFSGGITGTQGWNPEGLRIEYVDGNVSATNEAIIEAITNAGQVEGLIWLGRMASAGCAYLVS